METITERGKAGADLTSSQYLFVYADGTDGENIKVQTSNTNLETAGVLCTPVADEEPVQYTYAGFGQVIAGGVLEPFDYVTANGSGQAVKAASGQTKLGQYRPSPRSNALPDAAAGDIVRVYLFADKTNLVA